MKNDNAFFLLEAIGEISERTADEAKLPRRSFRRVWAASVAVIALIGILAAAVFVYGVNKIAAKVTIDASYCVELTLNKDSKILSCSSTAREGGEAIEKLGLTMLGADTAVEMIVERMIERGDLNSADNTVLLSVSGGAELRPLADAVLKAFDDSSFSGALLSERVEGQNDIDTNGVSEGKARLIESILSEARDLSREALEKLSVTALDLIARTRGVVPEGIESTGESSPPAVSRDEAGLYAVACLSQRGIAAEVEAVLLSPNGEGLGWRVQLTAQSDTWYCMIDAQSGETVYVTLQPRSKEVPTEHSAAPGGGGSSGVNETPVLSGGDATATAADLTGTAESPTVKSTQGNSSAPTDGSTSAGETQTSKRSGYIYSCMNTADDVPGRTAYFDADFTGYDWIELSTRRDLYGADPGPYDRVALLTSMEQLTEFMKDVNDSYLEELFLYEEDSDDETPVKARPIESFFDKYAMVAAIRTRTDHTTFRLKSLTVTDGRLNPYFEIIDESPYDSVDRPIHDLRFYRVGKAFVDNVDSLY